MTQRRRPGGLQSGRCAALRATVGTCAAALCIRGFCRPDALAVSPAGLTGGSLPSLRSGSRLSLGRAAAAQQKLLLEGTDLYGSHDDMRVLFRVDELKIERGQKMAVVGANGCGKSTLIRALGGKAVLPGGEIEVKDNVNVVMVDQAPQYDQTESVQDVVFSKAKSMQALATRKYRRALATGDNLEEALDLMEEAEAWNWDEQATKVMAELGLGELLERPVGELSGGEERRVALATALVDLEQTDLLILDEPTNHLSAEGCDWLQERLKKASDLSVVLVTHDRYFLDEVCDSILEIDGLGDTYTHEGGWSDFLEGRAKRWESKAQEVEAAKTQLKIAKAWMARGARGRQTKAKGKVQAFFDVKDRAEETIKSDEGTPDLVTGGYSRIKQESGGKEFARIGLDNATVVVPRRGKILDGVSFDFRKGSKVGIVGPNGAGKSTFLRVLSGDQEMADGRRVLDATTKIGFLTQEPPDFDDPKEKVLQFVSKMADEARFLLDEGDQERADPPMKAAAKLLKSVNFAQDKWSTELGMLSGGEKRRLQLLKVLSQKPNVLLLDEPTNDLDAVTVDSLEQLLKSFDGTVIVVSHDRSLLDGVCDQHVVFFKDSGKPKLWLGSHADLQSWQREQEKQKKQEAAAVATAAKASEVAAAPPAAAKKPALSQQERRRSKKEFAQVERDIEKVENDLEKVAADMQEFASDFQKVTELSASQEELTARQEQLYERWEELAELLS